MLTRASFALASLASIVVVAGCASSSGSSHREVGGLFDDGQDDGGGGRYARGGGGGGGAEAAEAETGDEESVTTTGTVALQERARGLFDFGGDKKPAAAPAAAPPPPPPPPPPSTEAPPEKTEPDEKAPEASGPRLVIYKGSLTVVVVGVEASVEKLSARAKELGGYVENQTGNSGANNATVTLRVPAEKFYDLVGELGTFGQVTQKQISAQDVTKQVFDVELRLDTAEKSRQRMLDLLKSATKMEEILQIENQVRRLTDEIEGMKGELRFLKDQVSMSTLAVTFYSNAPPPTQGPTRVRSRFEWINQVGIESVLNGF